MQVITKTLCLVVGLLIVTQNNAETLAEIRARQQAEKAQKEAVQRQRVEEQQRLQEQRRQRREEAEQQRQRDAQIRQEKEADMRRRSEWEARQNLPMVRIPSGSFVMGSCKEAGSCLSGTEMDSEAQGDETPQHRVKIAEFELGKTEVTVGQFRAFVEDTGYRTDAEKDAGGNKGCYASDVSGGKWDWRAGRYWDKVGFEQSEQHPVACVSWNDAKAYITWLNGKTRGGYRLPSEAEWEYAARAGTTTRRYWGDDPDRACAYANVTDETTGPNGTSWNTKHKCSDGQFFSAAVGSYKPNEFKLHDMLGNVWEWVQDSYHSDYKGAPSNGDAWEGTRADARVLRGGSWGINPQFVRAAYRLINSPALRSDSFGFRLARTLP